MKKIKNLFSAINTKITVLFLLLFIPLFLAGFSIYKYGYTSVKQEITDSSTSQLSLYAHSLSDEITRIQLSCYQLASNEDINYLANAYSIMGEYERSQYILRTAQLLSILQNSCMLTAKMTFFYTKNDIYILRGIFFCKSHAKYLLKYKLLSFKHNFKYS